MDTLQSRRGEFTAPISMDRLSNLPERLVRHILSFLDTRSAVQTSVLSRRWRSTWKHLSVLDLRLETSGITSPPIFTRYVENVLSLGYHQSSPGKVMFSDRIVGLDTEGKYCLFEKVSRYALSHETQHLSIRLNGKRSQCQSADLLQLDSENCSLKTLELGAFSFDNGFQWSSFVLLGRLELFWCTFDGEGEAIVDPFADLPCLKHLVLDTLFNIFDDDVTFCIFGVHLLSLRVSCSEFRKFEIYAPKLESLSLVYSEHLLEFTELTLPSLDHADIRVDYMDVEDEDEYTKQHMIPLFDGLKNAASLVLCSQTARMLRLISGYLEVEDQCSPFTRLKSLIVASLRSTDDLPEVVLSYLKGLLI